VNRKTASTITILLVLLLPALGWCGSDQQVVASLLTGFEQFAADSSNRFVLLMCIAAATLISEDLACIAAGLFAAGDVISPAEAVLAAGLGIYIGDILLYLIGYLVGTRALHHLPLKWLVSQQAVRQGRALFEKRGLSLIFLSRFIPGTRTATFIGAGLLQVNAVKLLIVFGCAVIIWTPLLVLSAMVIGSQVVHYAEVYSSWALWIFLSLLGLLFIVTRAVPPLFTWRGRRMLIGRWRRLAHWEFWPYYIVNSVTFIYVLCAGLFKYRRPTLFTVANPAIKPDSGFLGERKSDILLGLPQDVVGRWRLVHSAVEPSARVSVLAAFMDEHDLHFPVVLKPDRGQRGQGVEICADREQAAAWLERADHDYLMMEFLPGEEFGLFYYRLPEEPKGTIFSINRKKLLSVTGNGEKTLEELILGDERAVCMAPTFFRAVGDELLEIVPDGAVKQLATVGTHCRGALFIDGADLIGPELLEAIEHIVKPYKEFYFGRFDIKAPDEHHFYRGKNLKIIELNGLTSEATHIYDPKHSLLYAWRILIKQWSLAFKIAEQNLARGFEPMSLKGFIAHWYRAGTGRLDS